MLTLDHIPTLITLLNVKVTLIPLWENPNSSQFLKNHFVLDIRSVQIEVNFLVKNDNYKQPALSSYI